MSVCALVLLLEIRNQNERLATYLVSSCEYHLFVFSLMCWVVSCLIAIPFLVTLHIYIGRIIYMEQDTYHSQGMISWQNMC